MNYLADTHILIWILAGSDSLPTQAKQIVLDENNTIYYSFVNVWEVAIKHAIHKDDVPFSSEEFERFCTEAGFVPLITRNEHAHMIGNLKYDLKAAPREHRDPFDRLLLAQAKVENYLFLTHDQLMSYYNENCIVSV